MTLNEGDEVVGRIREAPWRVVGVGIRQQCHLGDTAAAGAVLIVSKCTRGHEDIVVDDLRIDVLRVEIGMQLGDDLPLHVGRDFLRIFIVVEIPGFIEEVQAIPCARSAGGAIIDERQARHG